MNRHMIRDRDYQVIAGDALWNYFYNYTGNPIVAMPTGTGKSVVQARFLQRVFHHYPTSRVLCLTHVKELIKQNSERLQKVWPTAPMGIYSAALKSRQFNMPITFGGIMSVKNIVDKIGHVDLILVDECHLISPNGDTVYRQVIAALLAINPNMKVVGFTATWWRLGQGNLTDGGIFTDICINMTDWVSFNWFIDQGYLVPLVPRPMSTMIDMTGVGMSNGDYNLGQLQTATEKVTYGALQEALQFSHGRKKWLVFAAGNDNAEHASQVLNSFGVSCTYVHDKVSDKDRDNRIQAYRDGYFTAICNNNILTTGFDDPEIDYIIMLRKTASPGLWVQMLGRGTRPNYAEGFNLDTRDGRLAAIAASGRPNCLVADFARNTRDLGPINDPVIPKKKGEGGGDAPIKICPACGAYNHLAARWCIDPVCGHEFEFAPGFSKHAGEEVLIRSDAPQFEWFNVFTITYSKHVQKGTGQPMLKVTYVCRDADNNLASTKFFFEWWCFEHPSKFMVHKAHDWWRTRAATPVMPETTDEALKTAERELKRPRKIRVWTNRGKYPEITSYEYE